MPNFLDLDAVHQDLEGVAIKLKGAVHALKPLSVIDYIANTKLMQELRAGATDLEKEFEATLEIVGRSFPSIGRDVLATLSIVQLNKLVAFARQVNEGIEETVAQATAPAAPSGEVASIGSENPPAA